MGQHLQYVQNKVSFICKTLMLLLCGSGDLSYIIEYSVLEYLLFKKGDALSTVHTFHVCRQKKSAIA